MKKLNKFLVLLILVVMMGISSVVTAAVGDSDNGHLNDEWYLDLNIVYGWGWLGATPGIVNLPGVNTYGGEPNLNLEIVTGSDGMATHVNPTSTAPGLWRAIDSLSNVEWYRNTLSDESRGSVAITDVDGDGNLDIVGSTTSGKAVEVMDQSGNFIWTFPDGPKNGTYMAGSFAFPSAPAVADIDLNVSGLEVVVVHRPTGTVIVLDGDNSDGINDGITFTGSLGSDTWSGTEGIDWDVLWIYTMGGLNNHGSAAIGDVDNDGNLEVVVGSQGGNVYVFDGATGTLETTFTTSAVQASPALANIDDDPYLEIVIGDTGGTLYVFEWNGITGITQASLSLGSPIYSSAAIGNIDSDSKLEIVVGTYGGQVYALTGGLTPKWVYPSTGSTGIFYASPSLVDRIAGSAYEIEWQMFRHDAMRTGYRSTANPLDVYIGSMDGYLYLLNGNDGKMIDRFHASGPIHGSPTVGDIDGDGKLNILFQSWGVLGGYTDKDRLWNVEETAIIVAIDIKPGSFPNSINRQNNGNVPVAILSSAIFDATTINQGTVVFAGASPLSIGKSPQDVNGDGLPDIVLHFSTQNLNLQLGDTEACLSGTTLGGQDFNGCDSVRIVK